MLFSSIPFLYYFLPITLIIYYLSPKKLKNSVLLIASLFFYGWGEMGYLFLMIGVILMGYLFGLLIEKSKEKGKPFLPSFFLFLSTGFNILILGYFKYADFFIENFNRLTGISAPLLRISLPIGISFYIFQLISYIIDVYREEVTAQRNPVNLATYISMFPQLIAGPIVRYSSLEEELKKRRIGVDDISYGIRRFILGLAKKVLLANSLGECCAYFKGTQEPTIAFFWLYGVAFMLQIYFDFSGYSDMAIGLGALLGFSFPENFSYPYEALSITEFWRRWHISLGTWFRDYVYIPLGGNRGGKLRWFRNIFLVWFMTGFWHGSAWNFIVWGLYFALFLILEKLFLNSLLTKSKVLGHIYVLLVVMISFLIFDAGSMKEAMTNIGGLFGMGKEPLISKETLYYLESYRTIILIAMIGATHLPARFLKRIMEGRAGARLIRVLEPVGLGVLLLVITAYLVDGSFNPFLYFRF